MHHHMLEVHDPFYKLFKIPVLLPSSFVMTGVNSAVLLHYIDINRIKQFFLTMLNIFETDKMGDITFS